MKEKIVLSSTDKALIKILVNHYKENKELFDAFMEQLRAILTNNSEFKKRIHSMKWRTKDPLHLKDKLERKLKDCKLKKKPFDITKENMFFKINDLVGFRILHLHTKQIEDIDKILRGLFIEKKFRLLERPNARTWDDESKSYFKSLGLKTIPSNTFYTSVHYIIQNNDRSRLTAEIQVRTLAEELWGEVDHIFNYPHPSKNASCREQIKVLARVTSSCTRLVDSIFRTR